MIPIHRTLCSSQVPPQCATNGSWFTENLNSENNTIGENVGFFAFPTVDGGEGVPNTYTTSYGMYICVKMSLMMTQWSMARICDESFRRQIHGTPQLDHTLCNVRRARHKLLHTDPDRCDRGAGAASVWPEYAMPTSVQDVEYQGAQMLALGQMTPEDYGQSIDDAWAQVQE